MRRLSLASIVRLRHDVRIASGANMREVMVVVGCVSDSPGIPSIFLLRLERKDIAILPILEIRIGYFGNRVSFFPYGIFFYMY